MITVILYSVLSKMFFRLDVSWAPQTTATSLAVWEALSPAAISVQPITQEEVDMTYLVAISLGSLLDLIVCLCRTSCDLQGPLTFG